MRRIVGNLLVVLSIVCVAATALWIVREIAYASRKGDADLGNALLGGFLVGGVFLLLAGILFLTGRHLRNPHPSEVTAEAAQHGPRHFWALLTYLGASVAVAAVAAIVHAGAPGQSAPVRLLWCLTNQPLFLVQFVIGNISLARPIPGMTPGLILVYNLLYFTAFFYPIYSVATLDRTVETVRYRRMRVLLVLFFSMHILIAILFAMMLRE
jgi:hypothetical protein